MFFKATVAIELYKVSQHVRPLPSSVRVSGDIWEGGADVTTQPYPNLWRGWDTDVVQISMKNCHTKGSDSALESLSLTKIVSIECSGVRGYLGRGSWRHYLVISWSVGSGDVRGVTFGSDLNKKNAQEFQAIVRWKARQQVSSFPWNSACLISLSKHFQRRKVT